MFGIFKMARVMAKTVNHVRETNRIAKETAALPMPQFVQRWAAMWKEAGGPLQPILRAPAGRIDIVTAQARLGLELPDELRGFYAQTNGFDWTATSQRPPFASAESVGLGSAAAPPVSAQLRQSWEQHEKEQGEPMGVRVFISDLASHLVDEHDKLLPFSDFDDMLMLAPPSDAAQALLMVAREHKHYPLGTVLEIEGTTATRFATLREALASFAAAVTSVARLAKR